MRIIFEFLRYLTCWLVHCLAELSQNSEPKTGRAGSCAHRPNVSTRSETNWPRIRRDDGRRRRFGDRRLAFDLRSQATRRSSSLAPSTVVTSDSRPVCFTSSFNPSACAATCAVCLVHSSGRVLPNNALTNTKPRFGLDECAPLHRGLPTERKVLFVLHA